MLLARVHVSGGDHYPPEGPVILASNHTGLIELVMIGVLPPFDMEFIGSGDIPLDPRFAWLAKLWGFIPVKRGVLDREAMRAGAEILNRKGALAIFPEGGIWNPGAMEARSGVALLSSMADAPVLPVCIAGAQGALNAMLRLKRPHLSMIIGQLIPPVPASMPGLSRREALEHGAHLVMERINALQPHGASPGERKGNQRYSVSVLAGKGDVLSAQGLKPDIQSALGVFFLHPIVLDILRRNLKLPVRPLMELHTHPSAGQIHAAVSAVLEYLESNPGLLTYRFGMQDGLAMQRGLEWLRDLAGQVHRQGETVVIRPVLLETDKDGVETVIQDRYTPPGRY